MYRTLSTMNITRSVLSNVYFKTFDECREPEKPHSIKYLETMFYNPLRVPEEAKVIQSDESITKR